MNVGKTLYVTNRKQWRSWLSRNHKKEKEIWLIYYKKNSGKPRIPYNDSVEEALCYGWIDSIAKPRNSESWVQRFSPRKPKSVLSPMNKERVLRLIKAKKITRAGLEIIRHHLGGTLNSSASKTISFPKDILSELKSDSIVWNNFQKFPASYKRIRIGWIDGSRKRPEEFKKRLKYFISMTAKNKRFGMVQ